MKRNETLVIYPGFSESRGFRMRIYESEVSFRRRDFFEHKHSDFEISYLNPLTEQLQGQRMLRIYDPDKHIIEIREMEVGEETRYE